MAVLSDSELEKARLDGAMKKDKSEGSGRFNR